MTVEVPMQPGLIGVTKESIARQLKAKGLRFTPQRLVIIAVLAEKRDFHPGARFGYDEAKRHRFRSIIVS